MWKYKKVSISQILFRIYLWKRTFNNCFKTHISTDTKRQLRFFVFFFLCVKGGKHAKTKEEGEEECVREIMYNNQETSRKQEI